MRRRNPPPDMTSLFDVLFILVFVSLVNAAMSRQETADARAAASASASVSASASAPPPIPSASASASAPPILPPPNARVLRDRAMADLDARPAIIARVSDAGVLRSVEVGQNQTKIDVHLIEDVPQPDIAIAYIGDHDPERRVCRAVARALEREDLSPYLVIITTDVPLGDLTVALVAGLKRDAERCLTEQRGVAIVVDPIAATPPSPTSAP
ncbi:MAG: hypothetical protein U0271_14560 [Polyangiaceae bacterium]